MDWQALHDGLQSWFSEASGVPLQDVVWAGDPVGMRGSLWAQLQLVGFGPDIGHDEVRYSVQDPDLAVAVVGNRRATLNCQVHSRDQRAPYRAYAVLEHVRERLYFPATHEGFRQLGVGIRDSAALVDLGRSFDQREESVASLDVALNWTTSGADMPVGTIEHIKVSGTVNGIIASLEKDIP